MLWERRKGGVNGGDVRGVEFVQGEGMNAKGMERRESLSINGVLLIGGDDIELVHSRTVARIGICIVTASSLPL